MPREREQRAEDCTGLSALFEEAAMKAGLNAKERLVAAIGCTVFAAHESGMDCKDLLAGVERGYLSIGAALDERAAKAEASATEAAPAETRPRVDAYETDAPTLSAEQQALLAEEVAAFVARIAQLFPGVKVTDVTLGWPRERCAVPTETAQEQLQRLMALGHALRRYQYAKAREMIEREQSPVVLREMALTVVGLIEAVVLAGDAEELAQANADATLQRLGLAAKEVPDVN